MDLKQIEKTLFGDDTEQVNKGIGYQPPQQPQQKIITPDEVDALTEEASSLHGVPKQLIRAIIDNESDRTPDGKYIASGKSRVAGHPSTATGLMQLINSTAKAMGVEDATDPKQNVMGGAKYLRSLIDRYNGDQEKALAAYFKGPKTVDDWLKQNPNVRQLPGDTGGTTVDDYLNRVSKNIQKYGGKIEGPSAPQLVADDINNPDYLAKVLFGEVEPQQTQQAQSPIGQAQRAEPFSAPPVQPQTQRAEPFAMPGGMQEQEKEGIIPRLAKAWGRSVSSLEGGVGGALELTHIPGVKNIGQAVSEDAKAMREFYKVEDAGLVDKIAEGVSSGLQFLIPGIGVAKGAKVVSMLGNTANAAKIASWLGIGTNAVLEAAVESGNSYNALQEKGIDDKEATVRALGSFGANLALITATNAVGGMFGRNIDEVKKTLPQIIKESAKKLPKEMLSEGFQEAGQEGIGTVTEKEALDAKNIALAGGLGALTAGIMSPIGLISENQQRKSVVSETPSTIAEKTQPQQFDIVDEKGNVVQGSGRNEPPPIADDNPLIGAGRVQESAVSPTEIADVPSVQAVPETQQTNVAPPAIPEGAKPEITPKEITATEEQLKSVKEKVSGIEDIEFQGSNPGIEGKNKKTGEPRLVPPTFEFKDKVSGGNFTLKEEDVTPERINTIVEGLRENVKPEGKENAEEIRSNAGQISVGGDVGKGIEDKSRKNIQRNEEGIGTETKQQAQGEIVSPPSKKEILEHKEFEKEQEDKFGLKKFTNVKYKSNDGTEKTGKLTSFMKYNNGDVAAVIHFRKDNGYGSEKIHPSFIIGSKVKQQAQEKIADVPSVQTVSEAQKSTVVPPAISKKPSTEKQSFSDWHKEQEDKYGIKKGQVITYNVGDSKRTAKITSFIKAKEGETVPRVRLSQKIEGGYTNVTVPVSHINGINISDQIPEVKEKLQKSEEIKKDILSYDRPPEVQKEVEKVNTNPSPAQQEAGNYKKAPMKLRGMDVSIENPAGSERFKKDEDGKDLWRTKMNHDYGYIRGTKGADAYRGRGTDQLDVFINPGIKEDESRDVFIVNQKDPKTGKFDEHKVMVGFTNKSEAAKAYLSNYEKGWNGMKSIVRMPMDKFKEWAYSDQTQYELKENESEQDIISKMAEPIYKGGIEFQSRSGKVNESEVRSSADRQAKQLYDDIQNKDIDKLTNRLPVLQNKASRKAFEIATGIKLPDTVSGTTEAIRKFVGEEKYDKHFADIEQAQVAKEVEAKAKEYNTERDKLLDSKVPGQQGSTYRSLIDNHAKSGYSVKVDKIGIREVYKLVKAGAPVSTVLPKKMIGDYALEKMPKYVEPAKSEFNTLTDDLRKIDKDIAKEKQFNKKVELNKKRLEIINNLKKLDTGKEMSNEKEDSKKTETLLNTSEQRKPTEIPEAMPESFKGIAVGDNVEVTTDDGKNVTATIKDVDPIKGKYTTSEGTFSDQMVSSGQMKKVDKEKATSSNLVDSYAEKLKTGEKIKNTREILDIADKVYGGTIGEGRYGIRDAYDALETAMNKHIEEKGLSDNPKEAIASLNEAIKILPTQTVRTEDQVEKQQFSTPPSEAYLAVKASGIKEGMSGLEPSAGDGNIATMMRIANKGKGTIHVNEIDARRRENLKTLGFDPTNHDAEYLHSTLPDNVKPDVVVMNPPFSSTGGRLKSHDTGFGAEHVRQALLRLKEGGRLVAIVGNGMAFGKPKMAAWWNRIKKEYNVRANIGISGKEYEKYGTGFDNNIIVIDKTGPTENIESAITGEGLTVEQGYDKLEPLMKEDVYGRIKGNVSESGKAVDEEKSKGSIRGETADITGVPAVSGSGRGTDTKQGNRAKPKPVENVGEPISVGSEPAGTVNPDGVKPGEDAGTVTENEQRPVETVLPKSGSGDVGRPERKQERVQLKKEVKSSIEEESGGVYAKYKVKKAVYKGAVPHPANISESVTMASIEVPDVTYELAIPKNLITSGAISDAQLEAITYACQAHEQRLPNGMRKEYLIGDGTGMGKARTLLGIIYENSLRGKKKFVYITKSKGLVNQLKGDMEAMGINIPVIPLEKYKKGDKIDASEGILFGTYSTVSGDFSSSKGRYNQVLEWFGKDTDSVFVFDESHLMKNVSESYVPWGSDDDAIKQLSEGSQRGQMGVQFKKDLPNARFVNASATAATEPVNLAYLTRLGLWGEGTPFKDFIAFLNTMRDGGVGAMELLARDMKANGLYLARSISYDGVNYDTLNHVLAKDEKMIYNDMADFWSEILVKMEEAAKNANMKKESQRIMKQFYAAQQRFFLQLMMSFQVETMIKDADTKLKNGNSIVISLFNTNEQQTDKKVSEAINNGIDIDSMDFSPKDSMKQMIENNFPIYQYEEYNDEDGAKRVRQVIDPNTGEPLINKENLDMRQKLIDKIENFRTPENPIDRIVNHFGFEKVAEITGRKKRIVVVNGRKEYRDRAIKGVAQKDINTHELKQFMNGDKRVAIISGAAATGFDLHASLKKKNQQRRVFYALQLSWSADEQMQSFGRVHRTMQASAPEIVLVKTDIASQQRLINTIQSRLASLGAISKGERESLSGGIFSIEDITDSYGTAALGQTIRDLDQADLIRMNAYDKEGNIKSAISQDVSGFLNRIMVLPIDKQNEAFAKFYSKYRDNVEHAKQTGTFDTGVEKISGENIRASGEPIVLNADKSSGIKTELVTIEYEKKTNKEPIQDRREMTADLFETKNKVSQRGYLYRFWKMDDKVSIYGPRGSHATISRAEFMQKYEKATKEEVEKSWKEEYDKIPDFETVTTHLITGSIFPVYNKIFFDAKQGRKIKRATLNDGSSLIGVEVSSTYIPKIKQNFGIGSDIYTAGPQELVDLIKSGSIIELDNGWKISERRVMGEDRIELDPGRSYVTAQQMEGLGLFNEIIAFSKRYFIPTDNEKSVSAMGNILKQAKPVRDLAAKTEDASAPIEMEPEKSDYSAPLSPEPAPMPVKNIIETTKNAPHGKKVEYAVASNKIGKQMVAKKTGRGLSFLDAKNKFYQKIVDLTWPISQIEDQWADDVGADRKKIRTIDIAISKVRGAGGIAKQFIEDNMTNILDSVPGKIRSKVYTELNKYLIAKRTVWLYENKDSYIDAGINVEDARTMVEFVETGAHSYSEEINLIAPRMWEFNKKLLQVKKDHGVIDDELLSSLAEPYYVPFYRDVDENTKLNIPKGEKYTNIGKGIKRIQGSTSGSGIIEPLQNMMQNSYETFVNAYRADVMNKIIDFAESSPELGKMFEKVPPKWVKVGTIEYRGEVDMLLRPKLKEFANKLGITVEEKPRVAGFVGGKMKKVLGKSAGNKIELMIGATESQFSHELGHQLHKKYSKWVDPFIDGFVDELNEVADTRYLGLSVPASYVSYCRNRNEKFAEFVSMYITDRENLQTIAPNAFMEFETRIALDNNLRELIGFKPSNVSGIMTKEKDNWVQDWHVPQDREVVSVLREGKIVSYRCPEEVADAIKNMHPAMFPTWFRIFTLPMSILRKGAVTLNIGFIIPNSVRDNQESAFNAGTIPVYDFLIGLKEYITNGDMYKQYYRLGGGMDSVESGTRRFEKSVDDIKYGSKYGKFLDQLYWKEAGILKGTLETGWAVMKLPFDLIAKMGEASEMASRIGTYRRAVVGMPDWLKWYNNEVHNADEAIHIARQATVDFHRFGSYGRTANELIPFINAAIQGYDKMIRTIKDDYRRALLAAFLYIFGPMMAFWLWNKDKEGYKAVPLQDKINNFIIMNPDEKSWIKIPKGHIVKFIGNPVQVTMEKIYGTVLKSDASIIKQVLSDVSPIDISSIPVSLRLIIEPIANYDMYWNREIEQPYQKANLVAGTRYNNKGGNKTSEAIKIIGKALNISPIMMQHEIEIVGAGTAKNILWLADMAMGKIDPARFGLEKMPVTKSFYGKIGEWGTDIDSALIMVNKEIAKTRNFSINKLYRNAGYTPEEIRKVSKANVEKIKLLYEKRSQLMRASEAIKHLRTTEE